MQLVITRSVYPFNVSAAFDVTEAELTTVFAQPMDPGEAELFWEIFSPGLDAEPVSVRLANLSRLALAVENTVARAMVATTGAEVPK